FPYTTLFRSELGQGTTLSFCLPRVEVAELEPIARSQDGAGFGGTETILLVEDEVAVGKLAARVLRQHGYTVLEAATGEQALAIAGDWPDAIDLLLTDVVMPRMGGVAVSERLLALRPDTRVL